MKKIFLLFVAVILQATIFQMWEFYGASFNAALALLILFGFFGGDWRKLVFPALFAGMALDALSAAPFGVLSLDFMSTAAFLGALAIFFPRENAVHFVVFAALASAWFYLVLFALLRVTGFTGMEMGSLRIAAAITYNVAGATLLLVLLTKRAHTWIIS